MSVHRRFAATINIARRSARSTLKAMRTSSSRHHLEQHAFEVFRFRQRGKDRVIDGLFETP
jgi:hypothetical protein